MITRALVLVGGLSGAAGLSQFPEFSQQYAQRLGGAVDELQSFVLDFDRDANGLGLSRSDALAQLSQSGAIGAARSETMRNTIIRYERLKSAASELAQAGPFTRAYHIGQINDQALKQAAWQAFKPALPLTFEGAVFGALGFFAGVFGVSVVFGGFRMLFRRRKGVDVSA